jgi:hypothetical protein
MWKYELKGFKEFRFVCELKKSLQIFQLNLSVSKVERE